MRDNCETQSFTIRVSASDAPTPILQYDEKRIYLLIRNESTLPIKLLFSETGQGDGKTLAPNEEYEPEVATVSTMSIMAEGNAQKVFYVVGLRPSWMQRLMNMISD